MTILKYQWKIILTSVVIILLTSKSFSQISFDGNREKKAQLFCTQIRELVDLASIKFNGLKGHRDTLGEQTNLCKYFFSKKTYGIAGRSRLLVCDADTVPALEFVLYEGKDELKSDMELRNLISLFDECLTNMGFEKEVDKPKIPFEYRSTTTYINYQKFVFFLIRLEIPTSDPSPLIMVSVFHIHKT